MKKILIYSLSIMVVAGAAISCKKTSKGKMSNDWELDSWSETTTDVNDDGDRSVRTREASGSNFTVTYSQTDIGEPTTTTSISGTLNDFSYTIEKDGNWSRDFSYTLTYSETQGGIETDYVEKVEISESGTWNFLGNVDEFKKNERVVFNTLRATETTDLTSTYEFAGETETENSTTTETLTYNDGDMADIMVVVESKRKELQMESTKEMSSSESTDSSVAETYSISVDTEISLTQE
ncbi:MAG: hypothetical protein WEA99_11540 [Brumimicrobium sp.]